MYTASMPGFLRTIIYMIAFYYLFKFAFKLLAPFLMQKAAKKVEDHLKKQFDAHQNQQNGNNSQSNVNDKTTKNTTKPTKKVGEYIDFEEVD